MTTVLDHIIDSPVTQLQLGGYLPRLVERATRELYPEHGFLVDRAAVGSGLVAQADGDTCRCATRDVVCCSGR